MRYLSTRGQSPKVGFVEALLGGLAPDGGLYAPERWPTVPEAEIAGFAGQPYAQVAAAILGRFAEEEIAAEALRAICDQAYATFSHPAVAPLNQLAPGRFLLELFHGPTLAFKDVAMQLLARLYEHALARLGRTMTIVCATSGDTGGAAVEAFRGRANVRIVALFPEGRISQVQRRFMTCAQEDNVRCVAVAGDFDDCQAILKGMFQDQLFVDTVRLSAVNSINFARIAAQSVYYFTAAASLGAPARPVSFVIPTGNFGDAYAGWVARRMGLPITTLVTATNGNDILARAFETGRYARGPALATMSPAMDIQVASNFERLYFESAGRDAADTARAFQVFAQSGDLSLPAPVLTAMRAVFRGVSVDEAGTVAAMADAATRIGEIVDPHTAVALAGADRLGALPGPTVILSTAHAAKFPEAVEAATGRLPPPPPAALALAGKPERFDRLPAEAAAVKAYVRDFVSGAR